jgi:DNA-binding HxlR family transcriptional regulator
MGRIPQEIVTTAVYDLLLESEDNDYDFNHIRFLLEDSYISEPFSDHSLKKALKTLIEDKLVERIKNRSRDGKIAAPTYKCVEHESG